MGSDVPASPQEGQRCNLVKTAAVSKNTEVPLVKGNSLHQILQAQHFIFNVSSTLEKLYRYKFDPDTNEVIEILVFKRIRTNDPQFMQLRQIAPKRKFGNSSSFCGKYYDVYSLISQGFIRGYMLYPRIIYGSFYAEDVEKMYFTFEKYEKKGR